MPDIIAHGLVEAKQAMGKISDDLFKVADITVDNLTVLGFLKVRSLAPYATGRLFRKIKSKRVSRGHGEVISDAPRGFAYNVFINELPPGGIAGYRIHTERHGGRGGFFNEMVEWLADEAGKRFDQEVEVVINEDWR